MSAISLLRTVASHVDDCVLVTSSGSVSNSENLQRSSISTPSLQAYGGCANDWGSITHSSIPVGSSGALRKTTGCECNGYSIEEVPTYPGWDTRAVAGSDTHPPSIASKVEGVT